VGNPVVKVGVVAARGRLVTEAVGLVGLGLASGGVGVNPVGADQALLLLVLLHALDAALGVDATEDYVGANVHVVLGGGLVADERVRRGLVLHVDVVRADEELGSLGSLVRGRVVEVGVAGAVTARHLRPLVAEAVWQKNEFQKELPERERELATRKRERASRNS